MLMDNPRALVVRHDAVSRSVQFNDKLIAFAKHWCFRRELTRLIGERVAVTIAAGEVHIRHGAREVAVHKQSAGRRQRIIDAAHLDGVAGRDGAVCQAQIATPTVPGSSPPLSLLRPLAEYEAAIGGSF